MAEKKHLQIRYMAPEDKDEIIIKIKSQFWRVGPDM